MQLANIASNGNNLETLRALRQTIAEAIDRTKSGRDLASLSRQLQIVMERITELEALEEDDPIAAIIADQDIDRSIFRRKHAAIEEDPEDADEDPDEEWHTRRARRK